MKRYAFASTAFAFWLLAESADGNIKLWMIRIFMLSTNAGGRNVNGDRRMSMEMQARPGAAEHTDPEAENDWPFAETVVIAVGTIATAGIVSWMAVLMYLA